ncbi:acyl transferase 7 [Iris pallida]|uniref:Acyl transferase 7 n=1 Tax=Iris pallida TaxID=29817 RepID=A0AAX6FVT1_IRIPA|nr:acyl transferase 7 [Iris pallida]
MTLFVNKDAPELVTPSEPTPSVHLPLSDHVDRSPIMRHFMDVIIVFKQGNEAAQAIRGALAKALVPYYPVAGRIAADTDGSLGVACTGEGVWFVKASSESRLEDVDYLKQEPLAVPREQLLPSPPEGTDLLALPIVLQVTQFKCGGFALGMKFNHAFFDGRGVGQFIGAVGEMARGLLEPTVKPVWCRDILVNPIPNFPSTDHLHLIDFQTRLVFSLIDIPQDRIERQKNGFAKETGQTCTTFDVVVAKLWRSRARVIDLKPDDVVSFTSLVSIRHLHEELPTEGGYYGNCLYPIVIEATREQIADGSFFDVVKIVKEAKESLPTKYSKSLKGIEQPPVAKPNYGYLALVDWRRLGLYEADFGWGEPNHIVPFTEHIGSYSIACILNSAAPKKGTCVMTYAVREEHEEAFLSEMNRWSA